MSLAISINSHIKEAMKAKDKIRLETLRAIKSAFLMAGTEKGATGEISEADELKILQRLQKQRKDSLDIYTEQGRADLAKDEQEQLAILEEFLPKQMGAEELNTYLKGLLEKLGASGPQDLGKVMGAASKELAGKADGKTISAAVRALLNN